MSVPSVGQVLPWASISVRGMKANGVLLSEWDKFSHIVALTAPDYSHDDRDNRIELVTENDAVNYALWTQTTNVVNAKLFEIYTTEPVNSFEYDGGRPYKTPGWNIYENDVLLVSESSNRGANSDPTPFVVTYDLRP